MKNSISAKQEYIRKTYCQEITPRTEDVPILDRTNSTLVDLWNKAIQQIDTWLSMSKGDSNKKAITPISLNFWLTGVRSENQAFGDLSVVLEREMLRRLAGGFSSYFALLKKRDYKARPPSPREVEKCFIALTWTDKCFKILGNSLSTSVGSKVKVEFTIGDYILERINSLPPGSKIAQVTVSKRDGKYWANFVCNIPKPVSLPTQGVIAVDFGSGDIACSLSNGKEFLIPARRPDKKWRKEIFLVESRVSKCKKGSRAWERRMCARRIMHNKSQYQHADHQRKLANWLTSHSMNIVVGRMKTRLGLSKSEGTPDQHWGVQNTGYSFRLLIFLKGKADEKGLKILEFKDPARDGDLDEPNSKFSASRKLLRSACTELGLSYPETFRNTSITFPQGGSLCTQNKIII